MKRTALQISTLADSHLQPGKRSAASGLQIVLVGTFVLIILAGALAYFL